ncbi:sensor histidine kinase KdpD [Modestobacter muralis]|uniref:histidine kinase n=1 Tax=Modestobacter muralis TaxID=1608614 RepID=A0A6P0H689_9ACTN|nr:ATP-binding protein [Modestobacter muralis]NEK94409.1 sensor histidine kinase KdpD [Modestobacter muralis]NEN51297.1 sensor histidine kinase KdpD [Modestobacter muralis]
MARGSLRIYLGAAPGVGKTFAVLGEAQRRADRGADVVVGLVETHGRPRTLQQLQGLEVLPRAQVTHRGVTLTELDVDGVRARRPDVVVIDELAHTNAPGSRNAKRWQDVEELLAAGISVLTTVNVQHLESLTDVVAQITGVAQQETVPDEVVRRADQVELVDMSPESLRRRMAHGNVYPAERVDAAMGNYFRVGNLTALRELALLWLADRVDEGLRRYRTEHDIDHVWEARERVVVALTGGPEGETLVRRAARVARRSGTGALFAVHVLSSDGLAGASPEALQHQRALVESLGGTYHQVVGDHVAATLLEFARGVDATQLVVGTSRRSRWARALRGGIGGEVIAASGEIDVHIVTHSAAGSPGLRLPPLTGALTARRRWLGVALALVGVPAVTAACLAAGTAISLASVLLVFLLLVVAVALVGGLLPAVLAAVAGGLAENWFFTQPTRRFTVDRVDDVVALAGYLLVAVAVATVVDRSARRATAAARAAAETALLASLSRSVLAGDRALPALLEQVREAFGLRSVTMVEQTDDGDRTVGTCGAPDGEQPEEIAVTDALTLRLCGRTLPASERRVLVAFAEQAAVALQQGRLAAQAAEVDRLAAGNTMRTALLAAVSHDLRTPLAGIKAASSALRSTDLALTDDDRTELIATVDESADRLTGLVDNLLDMSRLQSGALTPVSAPADLTSVVHAALSWLDDEQRARVRVTSPDDLPAALADPGLLERVVANLADNATRHTATGPVDVRAGAAAGRVELRVVDRGPGVRPADRERVFAPFQRLGDAPAGQGVGLGLAVARGLTEAMGGTLTAEDTPGGGLTMVVSLALAEAPAPAPAPVAVPS